MLAQKKGEPIVVSNDEHPRPTPRLEALAKLKRPWSPPTAR